MPDRQRKAGRMHRGAGATHATSAPEGRALVNDEYAASCDLAEASPRGQRCGGADAGGTACCSPGWPAGSPLIRWRSAFASTDPRSAARS